VRLDRKVGESVSEVEEKVYKRTSVNSTRLRQKAMRMEVDASAYATEGVLSMECKDR